MIVVVFVHALFHAVDAAFDRIFGFFGGVIDRGACALARTARILVAMTRRHESRDANRTNHERIAQLVSERVVMRLRNQRIDDHTLPESKSRSVVVTHDLP